MSYPRPRAWRRCNGCNKISFVCYDGHSYNHNGTRFFCGTMRVIRGDELRTLTLKDL